eukprot:m.249362 g.249362  ORF g.249362 m.249362 type:complete len:129 (-) comp19519_c0_seq1:1362-1748(-)
MVAVETTVSATSSCGRFIRCLVLGYVAAAYFARPNRNGNFNGTWSFAVSTLEFDPSKVFDVDTAHPMYRKYSDTFWAGSPKSATSGATGTVPKSFKCKNKTQMCDTSKSFAFRSMKYFVTEAVPSRSG